MASRPIIVTETGTQLRINIAKEIVEQSAIRKGTMLSMEHDVNNMDIIILRIVKR